MQSWYYAKAYQQIKYAKGIILSGNSSVSISVKDVRRRARPYFKRETDCKW